MNKQKPKILVIEDDRRQSELLIELINDTDLYDPIPAYNGREGFSCLKENRRGFDFLSNKIACILLDWQMPEMNGEQFLTQLREQESRIPFKRFVPVVVLSAYSDKERWELATNPSLGMASSYFVKPFDEALLINVLYRIVYQKEAEILREMLGE